jgi:prepilin signal peptidase PulO-like enzyme (type II secretory pathway)
MLRMDGEEENRTIVRPCGSPHKSQSAGRRIFLSYKKTGGSGGCPSGRAWAAAQSRSELSPHALNFEYLSGGVVPLAQRSGASGSTLTTHTHTHTGPHPMTAVTQVIEGLALGYAVAASMFFAARLLRRRVRTPVCGVAGGLIGLAIIGAAGARADIITAAAAAALVLVAALIIIIDLRLLVIPDALVLALALAGLAWRLSQGAPLTVLTPPLSTLAGVAIMGAAMGALIVWLPMVLYERLRGHAGLGLGDVKPMAAIGATTGPAAVPLILATGSLATIAAVLVLQWRRGAAATQSGAQSGLQSGRWPFAPGLTIAFLAHLIWSGW